MTGIVVIENDIRLAVPHLPAGGFDCIIADPPYGQTALAWDRWVDDWPSLLRPLLKPTGSMWVFGTLRMFMTHADEFEGWRLAQDLIWEKQNGTGFDKERFRRVHEQVAMFYRDDAPWNAVYRLPQMTFDAVARKVRANEARIAHTGKIGRHVYETEAGGPRLMRSVLKVRNCHRRGRHPTQKPEGILEPLLKFSCPPHGDVLDPFAGSGAVGDLCVRLGLNCTMIEGSAEYSAALRSRFPVREAA